MSKKNPGTTETEQASAGPEAVAFGSRTGQWVLAAAVPGSGLAFLDGTVVNVALGGVFAWLTISSDVPADADDDD